MPRALEVFLAFLRLGCVAFGGPTAHTAIFEAEFVKRRSWIARDRLYESISLTQLIPGPNSTELAMHIGYARAGWPGFFLAGLGFLLPAVLLVAGLAEAYAAGGGYAAWSQWIWGAKAVVAALVLIFLVRALPRAFENRRVIWPALLGLGLLIAGASVWTAFLTATGAWLLASFPGLGVSFLVLGLLPFLPVALPLTNGPQAVSLTSLFTQFFTIGSVILGSGYVLYAYLERHVVERLGWVTSAEMASAVVLGQVTPGPLFATAAFFGQVTLGPWGALASAAGIFAPAFLFSALSVVLAERLRESLRWKKTMEPLVALSLTLLLWESFQMRQVFVPSLPALALLLAALAAHLWGRVPPTLLLLAGSLAGGLWSLFSR